jgi:uncharacterized phage protein (TIGR02220 family)
MAKYRPIDTRVWNDRKFLSLSQDGRMLWLFLLTSPSTLAIPGVLVAGEAAIAEQLHWDSKRLRERFGELFQRGLGIKVEGRLVWLCNATKYQPPANPNMIVGWAKCWDDVPECNLKHDIWQALKTACKSWNRTFEKQFAEPFRDGSSNGLGNGFTQDQEQDQEQKQEQDLRVRAQSATAALSLNPKLDLFKDLVDHHATEKRRERRPTKPSQYEPQELESAIRILAKLTAQNGIAYTGTKEHVRLIVAQLRNGITEMEMRAIIGYCAVRKGWKDDPEFVEYLRPETLFGPRNISKYLDPARQWFASLQDDKPAQEAANG